MKLISIYKHCVIHTVLITMLLASQLLADLNEKPDSPAPTADTLIPKMFIGIVLLIVIVGIIRFIVRLRDR